MIREALTRATDGSPSCSEEVDGRGGGKGRKFEQQSQNVEGQSCVARASASELGRRPKTKLFNQPSPNCGQ